MIDPQAMIIAWEQIAYWRAENVPVSTVKVALGVPERMRLEEWCEVARILYQRWKKMESVASVKLDLAA